MARFAVKRVLLGETTVDSGHLLVIDPCYLGELRKVADAAGKTVGEVVYDCVSRKTRGGQLFFPTAFLVWGLASGRASEMVCTR